MAVVYEFRNKNGIIQWRFSHYEVKRKKFHPYKGFTKEELECLWENY